MKKIQLIHTHFAKVKIKYYHEQKRGVSFARNSGLRLARYDLIAFIDDDCIADKGWIEAIVTFYKKRLGAIIQGISKSGYKNNIFAYIEDFNTQVFFQGSLIHLLDTKNFVFKRSLLGKRHYFDARFSHIYEDVDFGLRALRKGIKIVTNPSMKAVHYGRTSLFDHWKREFYRGVDYWRFLNKWVRPSSIDSDLKNIINKFAEKKALAAGKEAKERILKVKSLWLRLSFLGFLFLDKRIFKMGYLFGKVLYAQ